MIKLLKSADLQFYFTLCGTNGHVRATSETYKSRRNALKAIKQFLDDFNVPMPVKFVDTTQPKNKKK